MFFFLFLFFLPSLAFSAVDCSAYDLCPTGPPACCIGNRCYDFCASGYCLYEYVGTSAGIITGLYQVNSCLPFPSSSSVGSVVGSDTVSYDFAAVVQSLGVLSYILIAVCVLFSFLFGYSGGRK